MNNQLTTINNNYIGESDIKIIPAEKSITQKLNEIIKNYQVKGFYLLRDTIEELELLTGKSNKFKGIRIIHLSKGYKSCFTFKCPNCNGTHSKYIV
jgi:hypothetical protein